MLTTTYISNIWLENLSKFTTISSLIISEMRKCTHNLWRRRKHISWKFCWTETHLVKILLTKTQFVKILLNENTPRENFVDENTFRENFVERKHTSWKFCWRKHISWKFCKFYCLLGNYEKFRKTRQAIDVVWCINSKQ